MQDKEQKTLNVNFVDDKYRDGLITIKSKDKWGYLDLEGKEVIPCQYEKAQEFSEGIAPVCLKDKWGFIDKKGETIIDYLYDDAGCFSEGLAPVQQNENWFYINNKGETILTLDESFFEASPFKEGMAIVHGENHHSSFINKSGELLETDAFDDLGAFSEGLSVVEKDNTFGYINMQGKVEIPLQYKFAYSFVNGYASVQKQDETWLVIDKNGEEVSCFSDYSFVLFTKEGFNLASKDRKWGVISNEGQILIPLEYDKAPLPNTNSFGVYKDDKWGVINRENEIIVPFQYTRMSSLGNGRYIAIGDNKAIASIIDEEGNEIIELELEQQAAVKKIKTTVQLIKLAIIILAILGIVLIFTEC